MRFVSSRLRPFGCANGHPVDMPSTPRFFPASPRQEVRNKTQPKRRKDRRTEALSLREPRFDAIPEQETKQRFVLRLEELLLRQADHVLEMAELGRMRAELDILRNGKSRKMSGLVRRFPGAFKLHKDDDNRTWCGFTEKAAQLLEEEKRLLSELEPDLVQKLRKLLMMSVDNRLLLDKVLNVRRCLGLPFDFREGLLSKYPQYFHVKEQDDRCYLELTSWDSALAVSVLERKAQREQCQQEGLLGEDRNSRCLRFPWIFKKGRTPKKKRANEIEVFQSAAYISPYKNSRDLQLPQGSLEADKFAVAVVHEFLSLTVEKRGHVQQLEQFRKEYRLPENFTEFLRRYDGIFYVVEGNTKSLLFLKEGYRGSRLNERGPLVLWKQRFLELAYGCEQPVLPNVQRSPETISIVKEPSDAINAEEELESGLGDKMDAQRTVNV